MGVVEVSESWWLTSQLLQQKEWFPCAVKYLILKIMVESDKGGHFMSIYDRYGCMHWCRQTQVEEHTHTHVHIQMCTHSCICTLTLTHAYTSKYTCTQIQTHGYIHAHRQVLKTIHQKRLHSLEELTCDLFWLSWFYPILLSSLGQGWKRNCWLWG